MSPQNGIPYVVSPALTLNSFCCFCCNSKLLHMYNTILDGQMECLYNKVCKAHEKAQFKEGESHLHQQNLAWNKRQIQLVENFVEQCHAQALQHKSTMFNFSFWSSQAQATTESLGDHDDPMPMVPVAIKEHLSSEWEVVH